MAKALLTIEAAVRGYHVFQSEWPTPQVGKRLLSFYHMENRHDRFAMTVYGEGSTTVVGHLLREVTRLSFYFTIHNG